MGIDDEVAAVRWVAPVLEPAGAAWHDGQAEAGGCAKQRRCLLGRGGCRDVAGLAVHNGVGGAGGATSAHEEARSGGIGISAPWQTPAPQSTLRRDHIARSC
jgi:hypothetical protein